MKLLPTIAAVLLAVPSAVLAAPFQDTTPGALHAHGAASKDTHAHERRSSGAYSHNRRSTTEVRSNCAGSTERRCQPQKRFNDVRAISGGMPPPKEEPEQANSWASWLPF